MRGFGDISKESLVRLFGVFCGIGLTAFLFPHVAEAGTAAKTFMQSHAIPDSEYALPSVTALATKVSAINSCFKDGNCTTTPTGQLLLLPSYADMRASTPFTTGCYRRGTWVSHLNADRTCPVDHFRVIVGYRMDCPGGNATCASHGSISFGCSYGKVTSSGYMNYGDCYNGNAIIPEREDGPDDCPVNFEWNAATKQCEPCASGYYKPTTGTGACVPEPTSQMSCPAGQEPGSSGGCVSCSSTTYKPNEGAGTCVPCPAPPTITGGTATNQPNSARTACVVSVACNSATHDPTPSGTDCMPKACVPSTDLANHNSCAFKKASTCTTQDAGTGTCGEACGMGSKSCTCAACPYGGTVVNGQCEMDATQSAGKYCDISCVGASGCSSQACKTTGYPCDSGPPGSTSWGGTCTLLKGPYHTYSCPNGFTLNDKKCVRPVAVCDF